MSGPTAERVAENIKTLRRERGMDLADVSKRMGELGQPVSVSGLSKVELGQRRVDVDELVALAIALDVSPNRLLLPGEASDDVVFLTTEAQAESSVAWKWAAGDSPLPTPGTFDVDDVSRFGRENRPHDPPDETLFRDVMKHGELLMEATETVLSVQERTGLSPSTILDYIEMRREMQRLADSYRRARKESGNGEHQ